jgi:hypothetical protein
MKPEPMSDSPYVEFPFTEGGRETPPYKFLKSREETAMREVDVYPVGLLATLRTVRGIWKYKGKREALRILWFRLGYLRNQARAGNWRAVRNYFNGYLAEPLHSNSTWTRCGHGWTERRALRDLDRHMRKLARDAG